MIRLEFPLKTVSALNVREHWAVKAKRVKAERNRVRLELAKAKAKPPGPLLVVRLTRISQGTLDGGDNLSSAMKGVRDQIACFLGVDDGGPLVKWEYQQEKGEAGVRVEIAQPPELVTHLVLDPRKIDRLLEIREPVRIIEWPAALPGGEE